MIKIFYNLLFLIFFVLSSPYYFWRLWRRGSWQENFWQRFGNYSDALRKALRGKQTVWFHAVSVGEVNLCIQLVNKFISQHPEYHVIVSTTTTTGMAECQKKLPNSITKIYYPVDFPFAVKRALNIFHPQAIILIEAEIWCNFLWEASKRNIPLYLFNARISDRSFGRYQKVGFVFRDIFKNFKAIGVQDASDADKLVSLGAKRENVTITGNLKFDGAPTTCDDKINVPSMLRKLHIPEDAPILVAGSTHAGEEVLLVQMVLRLRKKFPKLFLILVPRHMERCKSILPELNATGIRTFLRSELDTREITAAPDCLMVNTTGELRYFYGVATLTFIGKSITAKGGQNPIEPAALGKPVLFGPNMQNFTSIVRTFKRHNAAIQVTDFEDLAQKIEQLLTSAEERKIIGNNARNVVLQSQGGVERSCQLIQF